MSYEFVCAFTPAPEGILTSALFVVSERAQQNPISCKAHICTCALDERSPNWAQTFKHVWDLARPITQKPHHINWVLTLEHDSSLSGLVKSLPSLTRILNGGMFVTNPETTKESYQDLFEYLDYPLHGAVESLIVAHSMGRADASLSAFLILTHAMALEVMAISALAVRSEASAKSSLEALFKPEPQA